MKILIKKGKIVLPGDKENGKIRDLLITDGRIQEISDAIETDADQVIEIENLHVSSGWMDALAHFCDPGLEFKETLKTGARAAAAGGFTDVMVLPNTKPGLDNRAQIEYICRRSKELPVSIHPIGAISAGLKGTALAEMFEMHTAGALAFSDGLHPVQSPGLLLKALQYVKAFDGTIIQIPDDQSISKQGRVHEGLWSTRLGISGIPAIAEEMMVKRDLDLLRYTGSRLHLSGISLGRVLPLIREAREEGLSVTCSITPYHLMLTDETLQQFDSNYKVMPPLRTREDVESLCQALEEGLIDCLATHHLPHENDSKDIEFEYAASGMIGLESCFGILGTALKDMPVEKKVELLAYRPRSIFGLPIPEIKENKAACLTLFDPDKEWTFEEKDIRSKSKNTPFIGTLMKGKVLGILNKNKISLNN